MPDRYDVLIKNVTIIDGTGADAFEGHIGLRADKIAAMGDIEGEADRELDGAGLVASPGFIDIHSHADCTILSYPRAESFLMQGVTTSWAAIVAFRQRPSTTFCQRLSRCSTVGQTGRAMPTWGAIRLLRFTVTSR